jgi:hypothetical protein
MPSAAVSGSRAHEPRHWHRSRVLVAVLVLVSLALFTVISAKPIVFRLG